MTIPASPATPRACPACGVAAVGGVAFCDQCGARLVPNRLDGVARRARMRNHTTKLERARRYLLFVTIVLCIQFVILAALLHAKMGALTTRGQVVLIVGAMIVLGFGGLWLWSKRNPVAAILVALIAYITLWGVQIAINPVSILSGIILKILAIGALVGGLRAGLAARAEEARQAKAEGSRTTAPEAAASH